MREMERANRPIEVQPLLVPHQVQPAPGEVGAMEALLPGLREVGFDVEPFGGGAFIVQAVPVLFDRLDVEAFLRDLLDDAGQGDLPRELARLRERICARAACRAAVKAGDPLGAAQMQRLLDELLGTEEALRCPHGRPTMLLMTRDHMDRQFGRI
jgi:DNA mismatch repair protein MutL